MNQRTILAADLFCGAGGTSTGLKMAAETLHCHHVKLLAINHWQVAISTHSKNHPWADHMCANLDHVDPRKVVPEGRLDLMMASPECTHHSRARGGKPKNDQSRATAWKVLEWAEKLYIENILIENVPEFREWGPLDENGKVIERSKGKIYRSFINSLKALGYKVQDAVLTCADYGDPTTRQRLFIICKRKGKIKWPEPTHCAPGGQLSLFGEKKPWRAARECIDWSDLGVSIFERAKYGLPPLKENTIRKIMAGLKRFSGLDMDLPSDLTDLKPYLVKFYGTCTNSNIDEPLGALTAGGGHYGLCTPYLVTAGGPEGQGQNPHSTDEPMGTILTQDRRAIVSPFLVEYYGGERPRVSNIDEPVPTVTAGGGRFGLAQPFLLNLRGSDGYTRGCSPENPMPTITGHSPIALVNPESVIVAVNHGKDDRAYSVNAPFKTITSVDAWGMATAEPFLINYNGTGHAHSVEEPLKTITAAERWALAVPLRDGRQALIDIKFRMLKPSEYARATSFPEDYEFTGTREDMVKQIGNAVPVLTAKALCEAILS